MEPIHIHRRIVGQGSTLAVIVTERMVRYRVADIDDRLLAADRPGDVLADIVAEQYCDGERWASTWDSNDGGYHVTDESVWPYAAAALLDGDDTDADGEHKVEHPEPGFSRHSDFTPRERFTNIDPREPLR
ncbi:MAG: hypothetical protein OXG41_06175 [Acidimicrobiaceae bacterium]|nr:hypothetical protein [Acidimicrobiaceae bacterium]